MVFFCEGKNPCSRDENLSSSFKCQTCSPRGGITITSPWICFDIWIVITSKLHYPAVEIQFHISHKRFVMKVYALRCITPPPLSC